MAESTNRVTFDGVTWIAGRPEVLAFLKNAGESGHGTQWFEFLGTQDQLIGAGLVERAILDDFAESGQRIQFTWSDEFGDRHTIVRRGRGQLELQLGYRNGEHIDALPSERYPNGYGDWWKKNGAPYAALTAEILKRFARR